MKPLLFALISILLGCSKSSIPTPEQEKPLVSWQWESLLEKPGNGSFRDPVLYKNKIVIPAANGNDDAHDLAIFNMESGLEEAAWNTSGSLFQHLLGLKGNTDLVYMNTFDGIVALDPTTNQIAWQHTFKNHEISTYGYYLSSDYLYYSNKLETNGSSIPFTDSAHLVRYNLHNGEREILHTAHKSDNLEDTPQYFLPAEYTTEAGRELLIFQLGFLSPIFGLDELTPHLIAIDANTRETVWIDSSFCELGAGLNFPPIVHGDNVVMIGDWSVYSYNATTGERNWRTELIYTKPVSGFLFSGPKIYNEVIYCIDDSGVIYAVDANTGRLKFSKINMDHNTIKTGPAPGAQDDLLIREGLIFVNSWSKKDFLIFDAATGDLLEKYEDRKYSGENILYDEDVDTYFITTQNSVRAFKVER